MNSRTLPNPFNTDEALVGSSLAYQQTSAPSTAVFEPSTKKNPEPTQSFRLSASNPARSLRGGSSTLKQQTGVTDSFAIDQGDNQARFIRSSNNTDVDRTASLTKKPTGSRTDHGLPIRDSSHIGAYHSRYSPEQEQSSDSGIYGRISQSHQTPKMQTTAVGNSGANHLLDIADELVSDVSDSVGDSISDMADDDQPFRASSLSYKESSDRQNHTKSMLNYTNPAGESRREAYTGSLNPSAQLHMEIMGLGIDADERRNTHNKTSVSFKDQAHSKSSVIESGAEEEDKKIYQEYLRSRTSVVLPNDDQESLNRTSSGVSNVDKNTTRKPENKETLLERLRRATPTRSTPSLDGFSGTKESSSRQPSALVGTPSNSKIDNRPVFSGLGISPVIIEQGDDFQGQTVQFASPASGQQMFKRMENQNIHPVFDPLNERGNTPSRENGAVFTVPNPITMSANKDQRQSSRTRFRTQSTTSTKGSLLSSSTAHAGFSGETETPDFQENSDAKTKQIPAQGIAAPKAPQSSSIGEPGRFSSQSYKSFMQGDRNDSEYTASVTKRASTPNGKMSSSPQSYFIRDEVESSGSTSQREQINPPPSLLQLKEENAGLRRQLEDSQLTIKLLQQKIQTFHDASKELSISLIHSMPESGSSDQLRIVENWFSRIDAILSPQSPNSHPSGVSETTAKSQNRTQADGSDSLQAQNTRSSITLHQAGLDHSRRNTSALDQHREPYRSRTNY